jgi:hypothetical protein
MKTKLLALISLVSATASSIAAVNIGYVANSGVGGFLSSSSTQLTAGGVSVGFFSSDPTGSFWSSLSSTPSSAWSSILTAGFTDVRSVGTEGTGFDWLYPTNLGGTVQNIPFATLPQNTRIYVIGFNNGTFSTNNVAGAWSGATEYGVVSAFGHTNASQNFLSPADGLTKAFSFSATTYALTSSDVLKGSLASSNTVTMGPEPSTYALLAMSGIGMAGYVIRRRRRA